MPERCSCARVRYAPFRTLARCAPFRRENPATAAPAGWAEGGCFPRSNLELAKTGELRQNIINRGGQIR